MTRVLSWNILHGGGTRVDRIIDVIAAIDPDIVTLQEFRHGPAKTPILDALDRIGLDIVSAPEPETTRENSVLIASCHPFTARVVPLSDSPARCLHGSFPDIGGAPLELLAGHFPLKKPGVPYWEAMQRLPFDPRATPAMVIGDLNCGIPFEDSDTKTFYATRLFQQMLDNGWVDGWRSRHGDQREFTWVSATRKNRFRYDHALVSEALDELVVSVEYRHDVRENGLSDHSALVVELDF